MSNLFSYKKVDKVNPVYYFPHICSPKNKRPVEARGTVYKTYEKANSWRAAMEDEFGQKYYRDWW